MNIFWNFNNMFLYDYWNNFSFPFWLVNVGNDIDWFSPAKLTFYLWFAWIAGFYLLTLCGEVLCLWSWMALNFLICILYCLCQVLTLRLYQTHISWKNFYKINIISGILRALNGKTGPGFFVLIFSYYWMSL